MEDIHIRQMVNHRAARGGGVPKSSIRLPGMPSPDSFQYSSLDHPDQAQKCKLISNPACPLLAEDQLLA